MTNMVPQTLFFSGTAFLGQAWFQAHPPASASVPGSRPAVQTHRHLQGQTWGTLPLCSLQMLRRTCRCRPSPAQVEPQPYLPACHRLGPAECHLGVTGCRSRCLQAGLGWDGGGVCGPWTEPYFLLPPSEPGFSVAESLSRSCCSHGFHPLTEDGCDLPLVGHCPFPPPFLGRVLGAGQGGCLG